MNAANPKAGTLAPNTIATLYGRDLAFVTRQLAKEDLYSGALPTTLLGTGVRLLIDGTLAYLYYVSPGQINFLIPSNLTPGTSRIQLVLDGKSAESVRLDLAEFSPALFLLDPETVLATRLDGSVVTPESPVRPGEVIILFATGLGSTRPRLAAGQIPTGAAWVEKRSEFRVILGSTEVGPADVLYAGVAPGFAGLYQINLRIPPTVGRNPEIRIGYNTVLSPGEVRLPLDPGNP